MIICKTVIITVITVFIIILVILSPPFRPLSADCELRANRLAEVQDCADLLNASNQAANACAGEVLELPWFYYNIINFYFLCLTHNTCFRNLL